MKAINEGILAKAKSSTKEEALEKIKKAGLIPEPINWDVIRKVLSALRDGPNHSVDCEDIAYNPKKYSFSSEEFKNVFKWIEDYAEGREAVREIKGHFPEYETHFIFEEAKYVWNLMIGQGSATSLFCDVSGEIFKQVGSFVLDEKQAVNPGYHLKQIPKGKMGDWSKIEEEYAECLDAKEQGIKVMLLVELADLVGAIDAYVEKHHNISAKDLRKMAKVTKRAFKSGNRK